MSSRTYVMKGLAIAALSAIALAACESKSNLVIPPESIQVTVTPAALTLPVGGTGSFVATVTGGDQTTARTVTWSSSNSSVATVDANGNVTAVASGQASIIATSTADPNAKAAGSVTVTGTGGEGTPTITISSITNLAGQPVDVTNTKDQINVALNVSIPQGVTVSSAQVLLDGTQVCSQAFSSSTSAEASQDVLTITCPIPTQAYDTTTGTVTYLNGPHTLSAQLIGPNGNTQASVSQTLIFNNTDFIKVKPTFSNGTATSGTGALAPAGSLWGAGDLTFAAMPVIYSGSANAPASISVSLTTAATGVTGATGCQPTSNVAADPTVAAADGGAGGATTPSCAAKSATRTDADASDGLSVTFPAANAIDKAGAPGVKGMEDVLASVVVNSVTAGGQAGPVCINPDPTTNPQNAGCGNGLAAGQVRVDNLAPRVVSLTVSNTNGYVNADYSFADNVTTVDYGVDSQTETFAAGADASSLTAVTTGADLAETATNHDYLLQVTTTDALGNARTVFGTDVATCVSSSATTVPSCATVIATFGVNKTLPTISYTSGSVKDKTTYMTTSPGTSYIVQFSDTAVPPAGPSGFDGTPVHEHMYQYLPSSTTCVVGGTDCAFKGVASSPPTFSQLVDNATGNEGYFTFSAFVEDAAGNQSDTVAQRTVLIDNEAPTAGGIVSPSTISGGSTVTFTQSVNDNIDLAKSTPAIEYGDTATAGFVLGFPLTTLGSFGYDVFTTSVNASVPVNNFLVSLSQVNGSNQPDTVIKFLATNAITTTTDVAGNSTTVLQDISTNVGAVSQFAPASDFNTFAATASNTTVCNDSDANGCDAASKTSTTLQASAAGTTATFANPFAAVNFYYATAADPTRLILIGPGTVGVVDAGFRTWTYTFANWAPPASLAPQAITVYAVGVDSNGHALITQPVAVTLTAD